VTTSKTPKQENSPEEQGAAGSQNKTIVPTAPLPEHISQNIESIIALHKRNEQHVPRHQRVVEVVSAFFGRPAFLYSILLVICLWMLPNVLPRRFGVRQFDPPPFGWLQLSLSISSLLITTGVLITQNREEKLAEQRAQLSLQLNLISEQKIAKIIDLLEELRNDLPNVKDRHDPEAEVMTEASDPHAVMDALEQRLEEDLAELEQQKTSN
jgi:uncharacterized membrane protein